MQQVNLVPPPTLLDYADWCRTLAYYVAEGHRARSNPGEFFLHFEPGDVRDAVEAEVTRPGTPLRPPDRELTEEELVDDLFLAVRREGGGANWRWSPFARRTAAGGPVFLPLLVAQVLAAQDMADGGDYSESAYWPRLNERLELPGGRDDEHGRQKLPVEPGDEHEVYQSIWRTDYPAWLRSLAPPLEPKLHPPMGYGQKNRHVCLPLSQVLLRRADLERLPSLFEMGRYSPGQTITEIEAGRLVGAYGGDPGFSRAHAARVFSDEVRRPAAVRQVVEALAAWDGAAAAKPVVPRSNPRETELLIDIRGDGSRPRVTFTCWNPDRSLAGVTLEPEEEGRLLRPGGKLAAALTFPRAGDRPAAFRPRSSDRLLCSWSVFAGGFVTTGRVQPGHRILLLTHEREMPRWSRTAESIAEGEVRMFRGRLDAVGLPAGWCVLKLTVRERPDFVPLPWAGLIGHERPPRLVGGVRLEKGVFLTGAGPVVDFVGQAAVVDGKRFEAGESYFLDDAGAHRVEGPWGRKRIIVRDERSPKQCGTHAFVLGSAEGGWPRGGARSEAACAARGLLVVGDLPRPDCAGPRQCETKEAVAVRLLLGGGGTRARLPSTHPVVAALGRLETR